MALYNGATNEGYALEQVERVMFADGAHAVAFDTEAHAGQAYRLYKAAFDRVPDKPGLGYWIERMDGAMDLIEVSARFIDSPEFRSLYGTSLANRGFVEKLYENILDRLPDAAGIDWWVNQLDLGARTREKVLADFSESPENQGNVIALIGNGIEYAPWYG